MSLPRSARFCPDQMHRTERNRITCKAFLPQGCYIEPSTRLQNQHASGGLHELHTQLRPCTQYLSLVFAPFMWVFSMMSTRVTVRCDRPLCGVTSRTRGGIDWPAAGGALGGQRRPQSLGATSQHGWAFLVTRRRGRGGDSARPPV